MANIESNKAKVFPRPTLEGLPPPRRNPVPKRKPRMGVDEYGRTPLWNAVACGEVTQARELLASYADPNAADDDGWTPLHLAAQDGRAEAAQLLLKSGADPNQIDHHGNGPLWYAAHFAHWKQSEDPRHHAVLKMLLKAGADPDFRNRYGRCPRDILKRKGLESLVLAPSDS
jgi:ankyrin repeat protein